MPQRKTGSYGFELPPDCLENDFTGASHDAFIVMIRSKDPRDLIEAVIEQIEKHGVTHNQRAIFQNACEQIVRINAAS
jgi:hypothetical protein